MYNLQSGLRRQRFPPVASKGNKSVASGHTKAVTGLAIDSLNRNVVSCGLDGKLKVCHVLPRIRSDADINSSGTSTLEIYSPIWTGRL